MFCNQNWQDSKANTKVAKKAVCAGCLGKYNKRLKKRKTACMQTWNNCHPLKPLPAGSVMCGECVARPVMPVGNDPDTGRSEGTPSKRLKTGPTIEDGYDSDLGSDSGVLLDDPSLPDGGPMLKPVDCESKEIYCQGNWDPDGCLQNERRPCVGCGQHGMLLCSRCMQWNNWTCTRCFTPYHDSYDPNHRSAAEHRHQREIFERGGDTDSATIEPSEASEAEEAKQPSMVDASNWTPFPVLEQTDEYVLFINNDGNQCSLTPREYHERCEILRMVDRCAHQEGGNKLREHTMRRMLVMQQEGQFKGLLGAGTRLKTVAQMQGQYEELKRVWANDAVALQASQLENQRLKEKLQDKSKRLKAANRATKRRDIRLEKAEKQLATLNDRLKATLSEDGKLALVIGYIKSQIFGTKYVCLAQHTRTHLDSLYNRIHPHTAHFLVKPGTRSYKLDFKLRMVEASKHSKSLRAVRGLSLLNASTCLMSVCAAHL
jgi:hypothetical protein